MAFGLGWVPHFTSVINWTLRLGLGLINQVKTIDSAWLAIIDYSIDIGHSMAIALRDEFEGTAAYQRFTDLTTRGQPFAADRPGVSDTAETAQQGAVPKHRQHRQHRQRRVCLAAHDTELPGGPLKCQTFTVTPADMGDFPFLVKEHNCHRLS